jgi:hypothetical protein
MMLATILKAIYRHFVMAALPCIANQGVRQ